MCESERFVRERVPRLYVQAAKIAKDVTDGKGSIKQLVYERKHFNIKALYALVVHLFQNTDQIELLLKKTNFLLKEPKLDSWLVKILMSELLFGKKRLPNVQVKAIQTVLAYEQIFKAHLSDVYEGLDFEQVEKPRYVRVNTIKISVNEAVENFKEEGWILKSYSKACTYRDFLKTVQSLTSDEFMVDIHIPYLLIFPPKTQFYRHDAYKNGSIFLQDKASCLPVHILNPEPGSCVLDCCAAPGMKTTQCAAVINNTGKIYSVELNKRRFQTLVDFVKASEASCVEVKNADATTLYYKEYPNVEYIIVDPSCSGSGITDRVEVGQQRKDQSKDRLDKLAAFQIVMLRYILNTFSNAKRVVYSTCSVYPEENEDVVRQVLETCQAFKLVSSAPFVQNKWENFGSPDFGDIGNYCLYAKPDIDLTNGFFVAVFERIEDGESNPFLNRTLFSRKFSKHLEKKKRAANQEFNEDSMNYEDNMSYENLSREEIEPAEEASETKNPKKLKKKRKENCTEEVIEQNEDTEILETPKKKKKKKKSKLSVDHEIDGERNLEVHNDTEAKPEEKLKKKKKKSKTVAICEEVLEPIKVKKKKKSKHSSENVNEQETDLLEADMDLEKHQNAEKRKKKKKKSDKVELEEI